MRHVLVDVHVSYISGLCSPSTGVPPGEIKITQALLFRISKAIVFHLLAFLLSFSFLLDFDTMVF